MLGIIILNILMMISEAVSKTGTDYCKLHCPKPSMKHAACVNSEKKLIENCPTYTKIIPLDGIQHVILQLHNELRESVASGKDKRFPSAARMGEIFWDKELANLAEYSVRRCLITDPHCYTTPTLPNPGRSANIYKFKKTEVPFEELVPSRIVEWLETSKKCTAAMAANFPENPKNHIEFFGRAITDSNNQVGCAASEWVRKSDKYFLLVCLYTNDVQPGKSLYTIGRSVSKCLSESSRVYKNLCSTKENYNMNEHRRLSGSNSVRRNRANYNAPEGSLWQLMM